MVTTSKKLKRRALT